MEDRIPKSKLGLVKPLDTIKEYNLKKGYFVDTKGVVYKDMGDGFHIMKPYKTKVGYMEYILTAKDGKKKHVQMHRIVALSFIPNPKNLPHVDHKDRDKTNCFYKNLRWASVSDNNKYKALVPPHKLGDKSE